MSTMKIRTPAEFAALTRDIDWQRRSFLIYCLRITDHPAANHDPEETVVKKILGGYLTLAILYFRQFRESLQKQYIHQPANINDLDVKLRMQEALDKVVEEWHRVYAIIVAIRVRDANGEAKNLVSQMSPFIDAAMQDVVLAREQFPVILQFGQSYSLKFSRYSDRFAALCIPLWVLGSPWEWTILWHELAGEKVRDLKNKQKDFIGAMFNDVMKGLTKAESAAVRNSGWSIDWLEELFEDSFSVIHFPLHFLFVFKNLLERYPDAGPGQRHPPQAMRLATAMCLHLQIKKLKADAWPPATLEKWRELKDETQPERFAEFAPSAQLSDKLTIKLVWLAAQQILKWHQANKIDKNNKDKAYQNIIRQAIIDYSRGSERLDIFDLAVGRLSRLNNSLKIDNSAVSPQEITDKSWEVIRRLIIKGNLSNFSDADKALMQKDHPQVKKLLGSLNYQQLLGLSFSDTDHFAEATDILLQLHDTGKSKFFGNRSEWNQIQKREDDGKPLLISDIYIDEIDYKENKDRNKVKILKTYKVNSASWTGWNNKHPFSG